MMSHMRKQKRQEINPLSGIQVSDILMEEIGPTIERLLLLARENFKCSACNGLSCRCLTKGDNAVLECIDCNTPFHVMVPVYEGVGHEHVIGYTLVIPQKGSQKFDVHLIGVLGHAFFEPRRR